jgi:hypothetical protein
MIRYLSGTKPADDRRNSPGGSLRLARSPVAPNKTMTWFSGRDVEAVRAPANVTVCISSCMRIGFSAALAAPARRGGSRAAR